MNIKVLFFGHTAEITRERQIVICPTLSTTSRQLFEEIISKYPDLAKLQLLFSLNQQYVKGDEIISDGDELAIFTPVSGG